jgi:prepilin-type N-terminal cleavage/methylation domain-containing protein
MKRTIKEKLKKYGRGGFTLIELLVVISIISLLSSIILASLSEARDKAKISAFMSNLKQLELSMALYMDDNNGLSPNYDEYTNCFQWLPEGYCENAYWDYLINDFRDDLVPTYISSIDFMNLPNNFSYIYDIEEFYSSTGDSGSTIQCGDEFLESYMFVLQDNEMFGIYIPGSLELPLPRHFSTYMGEGYCFGA